MYIYIYIYIYISIPDKSVNAVRNSLLLFLTVAFARDTPTYECSSNDRKTNNTFDAR